MTAQQAHSCVTPCSTTSVAQALQSDTHHTVYKSDASVTHTRHTYAVDISCNDDDAKGTWTSNLRFDACRNRRLLFVQYQRDSDLKVIGCFVPAFSASDGSSVWQLRVNGVASREVGRLTCY